MLRISPRSEFQAKMKVSQLSRFKAQSTQASVNFMNYFNCNP